MSVKFTLCFDCLVKHFLSKFQAYFKSNLLLKWSKFFNLCLKVILFIQTIVFVPSIYILLLEMTMYQNLLFFTSEFSVQLGRSTSMI